MYEDSVLLVRSKGEECFICDQRLTKGDLAVQVKFTVPMLIANPTMVKVADLACASQMSELIRRRIREASMPAAKEIK